MKKITNISTLFNIVLAGLLLSSAAVHAQTPDYSRPFGYVKHTLKAGQFNLIGLTLHKPVIISGAFEKVAMTTLTDNDVDFGARLTAGKTYILEITGAAEQSLNGAVQQVTWSGNTLTTPDELGSDGLGVGDKYQLRAAVTIADLFGASNEAGLAATSKYSINEADVVYIPNAKGFDRVFYSSAAGEEGWYTSDFMPAGNIPIPYMDAVLVLRRGVADLDFVVFGSVKLTVTSLALTGGDFNYISTIFPVGSTLGNSGLETSLRGTSDKNPNLADLVYMPDGAGGFNAYYYSNAEGDLKWYGLDGKDASNIPMQSGIVIYRRGTAKNAVITPPASYSDL